MNKRTVQEEQITAERREDTKNDVQFPYVPKDYLHHFIRGYFDGDGHVNPQRHFVSFVGGSYNFMNTLKQILIAYNYQPKFIDKEKQYRIYLSGKNTIEKFSEWIYKDKELFLQRKHGIFQLKK